MSSVETKPLTPDERDALAFLRAIDAGELAATVRGEWGYSGVAVWDVTGGGEVAVFNDCGEWDYVEWVALPDGRTVDGLPDDRDIGDWPIGNFEPEHPGRWGVQLTAWPLRALNPLSGVVIGEDQGGINRPQSESQPPETATKTSDTL